VKGWTKSFFYSKSCSPPHEAAFLPSNLTPFEPNDWLTSHARPANLATAKDLSQKVSILVHRGLRFRNLVAGWVNQWIQPISLCPCLLCTYTGDTGDSLHGCKAPWDLADFTTVMKKMIQDNIKSFDVPGLAPFWMGNKHYPVSLFFNSVK
jgi:hypothetical protein